MAQITNLRERLEQIISVAYDILCNKIAIGNIVVKNEASLQMQFGVLLKQVGSLYEFSNDERFSIELETPQDIDASSKSTKGKARCDIYLSFADKQNSISAAIELKYFVYDKLYEAVTDNRFAVMQDLENLEHYKAKNPSLICYEIVYTDNPNYANPQTTAGIKLAPKVTQNYTYREKTINLQSSYDAEWVNYGSHYFMKVKF